MFLKIKLALWKFNVFLSVKTGSVSKLMGL